MQGQDPDGRIDLAKEGEALHLAVTERIQVNDHGVGRLRGEAGDGADHSRVARDGDVLAVQCGPNRRDGSVVSADGQEAGPAIVRAVMSLQLQRFPSHTAGEW